ncbi:MAG: aminotransferase class IV [Solirubrobacterales bacterium]|jgi:branched-chain amino acid aminotransferase
MGFFASVNGIVTPAEEARVSVLDNGFTFGDSVYETLRTYGGRPFEWGRHMLRLRGSAGRLGFDIPPNDNLLRHLDAVLAPAANPESYIRIMISRGVGDISYHFEEVKGPTVVIAVKPCTFYPESHYTQGVPVALVSIRRNHPQALDPAIKSGNLLNNVLALREAQALGAEEALLLNQGGEIAEGASTNVFIVRDGTVITPVLEAGILAGITREVVLEIAQRLALPVREQMLRPADLLGADEAFLTSTTREIVPIRSVDGRPVGPGWPGPVTKRILKAFRAYAPGHCA